MIPAAQAGCAATPTRQPGPPLRLLLALRVLGGRRGYQSADEAVSWCLQKARDLGLSYYIVLNLFVRGMARFNQGRLSEGLHGIRSDPPGDALKG